jgi:hypothetical protein
VTLEVDGGRTSTAAVNGAGQVRVDLSGPVGTRDVTISSTGTLGRAKITMPTSPTATDPTPEPGDDSTRSVNVVLASDHPGYATLNLGTGTTAGLVTVQVQGGSTARVAVNGPGRVRTDLSGPAGARVVTITSTGMLGQVSFDLLEK